MAFATDPPEPTTRDVLRDLVRDAERASVDVRTSPIAAVRIQAASVLDRCALALRLILEPIDPPT